jgi:predicted nuclease of predicted toxin-antitoxin system
LKTQQTYSMKILLDECIPKKLKHYLNEFDVYSVVELGWAGIKNGHLMALCIENKFDVLITIDKNLMFQQNLDKYNITIAVLNSKNSTVNELLEILPSFKNQINSLKKHTAYVINKND